MPSDTSPRTKILQSEMPEAQVKEAIGILGEIVDDWLEQLCLLENVDWRVPKELSLTAKFEQVRSMIGFIDDDEDEESLGALVFFGVVPGICRLDGCWQLPGTLPEIVPQRFQELEAKLVGDGSLLPSNVANELRRNFANAEDLNDRVRVVLESTITYFFCFSEGASHLDFDSDEFSGLFPGEDGGR